MINNSNLKKIKFIVPDLPTLDNMSSDIKKMYNNGIFTNFGPFERRFEESVKNKFFTKSEVITVSNATTGLMIALKSLSKTKGVVLLPSFTFAATLEAVIWNGLTPVFLDVDLKSWNIKCTDECINLFKRDEVAAVLYCNPFGIGTKFDEWTSICKKYKVPIICDSAAGIGSKYADGKFVGTKADIEVLSMHATKSFGIGEGGLIVTKNKLLAKKIRSLKNFGFNDNHVATTVGFNAKMGEIYSIIGLHLLNKYQNIIDRKRKLLYLYIENLKEKYFFPDNIKNSTLQFLPLQTKSVSHRKKIEFILKKENIEYRRYYYPSLDKHPAFNDVKTLDNLKNTHHLSSTILALPLHTKLTKADVERISKLVCIN